MYTNIYIVAVGDPWSIIIMPLSKALHLGFLLADCCYNNCPVNSLDWNVMSVK